MRCPAWVGLIFLCALSSAAAAAELPPDLAEKEQAAFGKIETEFVKLARVCSQSKAYDRAREVLRVGLAVCPESAALAKARKGLEGKKDETRESFVEKYPKKRDDAFIRCAKALASAALQMERKGHPEEFDRLFAVARRHFASEAGLKAFKLEWFGPYRRWMRKAEVKKLEKGWDLVGGEWLDEKAVAAGNAKHSVWSDPWVLTDDVYEVRTTLPLRKALAVLGHAASFREFFLSRFEGEWELVPPAGKLPIVVTATQDEYRARLREASKGVRMVSDRGRAGAAMYHWTSLPLNPVLMTYEPVFPNSRGGLVKVPIGDEELFAVLQHELAHQLAFEYSRHAYTPQNVNKHCYWAIEGLANFFACYRLGPAGFRLNDKRRMPHGDRTQETPFWYCKNRSASLIGITDAFKKTDAGLKDPEDYLVLATAAWFLLEGEGGRYRDPFLRVLQIAHQVKEDGSTFSQCFDGIPLERMQKDWERFVRQIEIEG